VNRAPEGLLGAAVAEVGVLDLLKVCSMNLPSIIRFSSRRRAQFADFTIGATLEALGSLVVVKYSPVNCAL
jgi:hypothetical protein